MDPMGILYSLSDHFLFFLFAKMRTLRTHQKWIKKCASTIDRKMNQNFKEDPVLQKLPVILYSSIITKELKHKGDSVGADRQISKPDLSTIPEIAIELIRGGKD